MDSSAEALSPGDEKYIDALRWKRSNTLTALEELERQRAQIVSRIAQVTNQIRALDELLSAASGAQDKSLSLPISRGDGASGPLASEEVHRSGLFARTNVPELVYEAAQKTLERDGHPMHYRELAAIVQRLAPLRGKDPAATLLAHLSRAPERFCRVGRGIYWLAGLPQQKTPKPARRRAATRKKRRKKISK